MPKWYHLEIVIILEIYLLGITVISPTLSTTIVLLNFTFNLTQMTAECFMERVHSGQEGWRVSQLRELQGWEKLAEADQRSLASELARDSGVSLADEELISATARVTAKAKPKLKAEAEAVAKNEEKIATETVNATAKRTVRGNKTKTRKANTRNSGGSDATSVDRCI